MSKLLLFLLHDDGPTAVEYAVMLAMILGICFATIVLFGQATADSFSQSSDEIDQAFNGGS